MEIDVLIFGGGAAGLWLLDQLSRRGDRVLLLEAGRLGQGQTVASQGIIHGGLKYTLQGLLTPAAREIRNMPEIWRRCLAGEGTPDLRETRLRSPGCHLWRTDSLRSRLGMLGARVGLRVTAAEVPAADRPAVFAGCPGAVARLDEQVIAPASFIADLARQHQARILQFDAERGLEFVLARPGVVERVMISHQRMAKPAAVSPRYVVFAAGAGNGGLRRRCGLPDAAMQKRPLHMVLVRGSLPELNGHCVDGARTRVTITSDRDAAGRTVWQVGGQLAEDGVGLDDATLVRRAHDELQAVLPAADLSPCEWATYRVDRAERAMARGGRPDTASVLDEGNVFTAWPTKLTLAPQLARMVEARLPALLRPGACAGSFAPTEFADWPRPAVALPPWETVSAWHQPDRDSRPSRAA